jgi:hypothetical protein
MIEFLNKFSSIAVYYIANVVTIGLNGVTVGYFRMPMIARLIVFVSFTLFLCLNAGRAGALDLVNVVLAPLPPFFIEGGTPVDPPGIVTEILTEAFRRDGKLPKYAYMPAPRAEHTVRNGRAMATVIPGEPGNQAESFILSDSLLRTTVSAFVGAGYSGPPLNGFKAIADHQLAGQRSGEGRLRVISIHGDPVLGDLLAAGVVVEEVPGIESALALVVRAEGRVVLVTFTDAALYLAQNTGVPPSLIRAFTLKYSDFFLAIARSRPGAADLTARFNRVLESLHRDGTVDAILARYGATQAALDQGPIRN